LVELNDEDIKGLLFEIFSYEYPDLEFEEKQKLARDIIEDYQENIKGSIEIERYFDNYKNKTIITLNITSAPPITNVSLYESLPKCAAHYASEVIFNDNDFEIVNDDPLIVWHFSENKEKIISYDISKELPESCKEMFEAIVVKNYTGELDEQGRNINALLITIIITTITFFSFFVIRIRRR